jgi:hypothetical protein
MIVQSLMHGDLTKEGIITRFICFGVNGASFFQGYYTKVTSQLKEKNSLYMMEQHCMAHKRNLVQGLSNLPNVVTKLKDLLHSLYSYLSSSSKDIWNSINLSRS